MQNTKTILNLEVLADVSSAQYGTLEALFVLAAANGIGITDDLPAGTVIQLPFYDTSKKVAPDSQVSIVRKVPYTASVIYGQTPIDIAMQQTGTLENVFALAALNGIGITDTLAAGTIIETARPDTLMKETVRTLQQKKPASGTATAEPGGIGYMQIESSFIVS